MFTGQVALITGAARGIGREIALTLAREGANIVLGDINLAGIEKVKEEIEALGREALAVKVDVSSREDVLAMVDKAVEQFSSIDILVNNAGIAYIRPFDEITEEEWDRVMSINLKGAFLCTQAVLPVMKEKGRGKIISLASLAGKTGGALVGAHYSASKAAIISLTKSVAKHAAKYGINVNAVAPGYIDTDMTTEFNYNIDDVPLGRLGQPADIADAVKFLASEDSRYITGELLDVDGGILMD